MKNLKKISKILIVILLLVTLTGCTKQLKDETGKVVKNEITGQTITENIICKPTDKETIKLYKENKKNIKKLPECKEMKFIGKNEDLWNTFFIRPLGFIIVKVGEVFNSTAVSIVIITLLLRAILFPMNIKTMKQSENMKKANPEIARIEKKYEGKTDNESMTKKGAEMMAVYKKYDIKPLSGCLFAFIQLPILFAFWEAINRVPAIFEEDFLILNMGTTPLTGMTSGAWYYIIVCIILVLVTYLSYKFNPSMQTNEQMAVQQKTMTTFMTVFIGFMSFTLPTAIAFYWITSSLFTIIQNVAFGRRLKHE